ncbi:pyruvate synthase subunit beta [Candidatus Bathyarchaeota archaeon]|nr:MAG: pyruvate synthase subunit beta [Candidatus Bathyarchaeota archaeon]
MSEKYFKKIEDLPREEWFVQGHRACQGCGLALATRLAMKALGPNTIVATATGCLEVISSPYPYTSWAVPWIHVAFENAAAVASGIEAALKALMRKGVLEPKKINVVAMAGDGGTADIGLQALSGALERWHDFVYICLDNEAYMNTGIQRSGTTPYMAWTTTSPVGKILRGKWTVKKNMPAIAAAHGIPYVATATVAYPLDLVNKVKRAAETEGPAYIHILCPCTPGWRISNEITIKISRLAVQTGFFPLYEIVNGELKVTVKPGKRKPVAEYLKLQGRFRHLTDEDIAKIQEHVDRECAKLGIP